METEVYSGYYTEAPSALQPNLSMMKADEQN